MGGVTPSRHIGDQTTAAQRRRIRWAESLTDQLKFVGWTDKQFKYELALVGLEVSRQTVQNWLSGRVAPSPENQAVIAKVLRTAPHLLFPVEAA